MSISLDQPIGGTISPTLPVKIRRRNMSQKLAQEQHVMLYSNDASMVNQSNVESTLQVGIP